MCDVSNRLATAAFIALVALALAGAYVLEWLPTDPGLSRLPQVNVHHDLVAVATGAGVEPPRARSSGRSVRPVPAHPHASARGELFLRELHEPGSLLARAYL